MSSFKLDVDKHINHLQTEIEWHRIKKDDYTAELLNFIDENKLTCDDCANKECKCIKFTGVKRCVSFKLKDKNSSIK